MTKKQLYASSFVAVISIFSILGFLLFDDDNAKADSDVVTTNVQIEKSIHDTDDDIRRKIRIAYERMMISGKIPGKFFRDPYSYSMDDGRMIIPHPKDRGVSVEPIKDSDILDLMIGNVKIPSGSGSFSFDIPIIGTGASIYLFKSAKDLKELGYETISYRERLNKDEKYRRNNIAV